MSKDKFYIIRSNGKIVSLKDYLKNKNCSDNFKILLKREVFKIAPKNSNLKPDYLKYAKKLGFAWEERSDNGILQLDYKAQLIIKLLEEYSRFLVRKIGLPIYEVKGSNMFDLSYPIVESYANLYGDRLYQFQSDQKKVVMSYDASYPQFNIAAKKILSKSKLPFAHFSISDCYRHEQKGELMMLFRQRRFFMPDLHPYFENIKQAFKWYKNIEKSIIDGAKEAGEDYEISGEVSSQEYFLKYQKEIQKIAIRQKKDILIKVINDNQKRYWIINMDYKLIDKLEQSREIGCIQIDVQNAKRMGILFQDNHKKIEKHPVIIHSAVPGGIERYLYMLLNNFPRSFPVWLHPIQIRIVPLSPKYLGFSLKLVNKIQKSRIRVDIDDNQEVVSKRIARAKNELVPYVFVIGEKELKKEGNYPLIIEAIKIINLKAKNKPFLDFGWPQKLSKRVD